MKNMFTEHPHSVGETYFQHMKMAAHFGVNMLCGGLACLIHAVFPFLFQKTASNILLSMTYHFVDRMPRIEPRIAQLSQAIQSKQAEYDET